MCDVAMPIVAEVPLALSPTIINHVLAQLEIEISHAGAHLENSPTTRSQQTGASLNCPGDVHLNCHTCVAPMYRGCAWPIGLSQTNPHRLTKKFFALVRSIVEHIENRNELWSSREIGDDVSFDCEKGCNVCGKCNFAIAWEAFDFVYCGAGV